MCDLLHSNIYFILVLEQNPQYLSGMLLIYIHTHMLQNDSHNTSTSLTCQENMGGEEILKVAPDTKMVVVTGAKGAYEL